MIPAREEKVGWPDQRGLHYYAYRSPAALPEIPKPENGQRQIDETQGTIERGIR